MRSRSSTDTPSSAGFANTTAVDIATRAGVTTRTFFRYFSDKQALVFADAESLRAALIERILQATTVAEPLQTVMNALAGFAWESLGSRDIQRQRGAMIDANPDLLERDLIKQQRWPTSSVAHWSNAGSRHTSPKSRHTWEFSCSESLIGDGWQPTRRASL